MNYTKFTPQQKVLIKSLINKLENSGCSTQDIIEVLTEVCGSLLTYMAPSKEELIEYLDKNLLPEMRRVALAWNDLKQLKDEYGNI